METVEIQVTKELAQQLRFYKNELPRLLELGLRFLKTERMTQPIIESTSLSLQEQKTRQPIRAGGKPASDMIIEERENRSWNKT